ncbi:hypothetical protein QFC19_004531 [Naganishia cerealis]|uniref:Uncharacterized protein n=1 Tax=Naganishia cerealis TaxID=610337 RepID=A0ACC2VVE3_9TREE|nr:hypothetical protein QFC19_004531 [Naganishia cerealis]
MPSFLPIDPDSDFSIHNIPFGVFSTAESAEKRCGTRIGDTVVDLRELCRGKAFDEVSGFNSSVFEQSTLNDFAAQPLEIRRAVRSHIQALFTLGASQSLEHNKELLDKATYDADEVKMHLPVRVGDYTDFCASEYHTANAGRLMKVPGPPLPPAWNHLPIGYHGRASSIVISGTPITRPRGLRPPAPGSTTGPTFGPTASLDMEYEMAAIVGGQGNQLGESLSTGDVMENIFGLAIMNDWSAREIQGFEMIPLGPFNGKNFGTTVSPWIVTLDALQPFKTNLPQRENVPPMASYLHEADAKPTFDIELDMTVVGEFILAAAGEDEPTHVMHSNLKHLAYSFGQMLAHHTVSGCPMQAGDMLGSGTISGPEPKSLACLLEITERGTKPFRTSGGQERVWLQDGDRVDMTAVAKRTVGGENGNVGFGVCSGVVKPALV